LNDYPVKITGINDVTIDFDGSDNGVSAISTSSVSSIRGSIDRVTGDVEATSMLTPTNPPKIITSMNYLLKCRPAQRMF
jgi:hypothetical protein